MAAGDIELQVLVGSGLSQPLIKALSAQCGNIHLHSWDMLLWQENHEYLVGSAHCFMRDLVMNHVVLVWRYTKVGKAWSPLGAHLVAMPLGCVITPLAYTTLEDNLVLALPPAWL